MSFDLKESQPMQQVPRPRQAKKGVLTVKGGDVYEALVLAKDPTARSKDHLLRRAKCVVKYAKATHLSDSELRGVSWFAHLPGLQMDNYDFVFDEANLLAGSFWAARIRDPDAVLRLAKKIRERLRDAKSKGAHITSHLTSYSDSKAARWKRGQREQQALKPPKNVEKFAVRLRMLNRPL